MAPAGQKATHSISRRGMLAGGAGLALAGITACSGSPPAPGSSSPASVKSGVERPNLLVAAVPAVTNMALFLAKSRGFFQAEGLNVNIQSIQSSTVAIAGQLHGLIDVAAGAYVSYILSQAGTSSAASWHVLAEGAISRPHSQQVLVAGNSPVKSIGQLRGRTVASNILDNIGTLLVQSVLTAHNIPLSAVKLVAVPFPDMASALVKGDIDAGWFDEPFQSAARLNDGAKVLFDTCQGATANFPISGYVVTSAWARKYPRTAAAFARAIQKGQELADTERSADEQGATQFIAGITPKAAAAITFDSYPSGAVDTARLQRVADVMHQFGLLRQEFDMSVMTRSVT